MNRAVSLAAAASLMAWATVASAEDTVFQWQAGDLNTLERIADTHQRIGRVARDYCTVALRGTREAGRLNRCIKAVVDEVVDSIDDPRLTAYATTGKVDDSLLATR